MSTPESQAFTSFDLSSEKINNKEKKVDLEWFSQFKEHGNWDNYSFLSRPDQTSYQNQKKEFFLNKIDNPQFEYPDIDLENLEVKKRALTNLKKEILNERETLDASSQEDQLKLSAINQYRIRINEKLAEIGLLQAIKNKDIKRFKKYNEFIYGKPRSDIYAYTIQEINEELDEIIKNENETNKPLVKSAQELKQLLPQVAMINYEFKTPNNETFKLIQKTITQAIYDEKVLSRELDETFQQQKISSELLCELMNITLDSIQADNWRAIIDPLVKNIITNQNKKTISIPSEKTYEWLSAKKLIVHEAGTHVLRAVNGEKSMLQLLGAHLDRDEKGEEGAATIRTQVFDKEWLGFTGKERYLACGYAYGGQLTPSQEYTQPQDFKHLFELMKSYFTFKYLRNNNSQPVDDHINQKTYDFCARIFRSPDPSVPGLISTKDTKYREGNIDIWSALIENPSRATLLTLGKFDLSNPRHQQIIDQLNYFS